LLAFFQTRWSKLPSHQISAQEEAYFQLCLERTARSTLHIKWASHTTTSQLLRASWYTAIGLLLFLWYVGILVAESFLVLIIMIFFIGP